MDALWRAAWPVHRSRVPQLLQALRLPLHV